MPLPESKRLTTGYHTHETVFNHRLGYPLYHYLILDFIDLSSNVRTCDPIHVMFYLIFLFFFSLNDGDVNPQAFKI